MFKLLIFDWDGTLIDSQARIIASMQAAADELGHQPLCSEAVRNIIGLGLPEAIRALIPEIEAAALEQMRERYAHHFLVQNETPTELYPGVTDTLSRLRDRGYRLAVATGKSRRGLDRALNDTGLTELFELTRCADETKSKPDPCMLIEILEETGLAAGDALMIGDTEYDLEMGYRIGMPTVAVSYGAHHLDRLRQHKPRTEIHQFPELENWLDNLTDELHQRTVS
ncbi:hydrolase [Marinobacterium zhoushanense]|uniref:Hydrolase n=1 Tax=Marinobacterium zhoushanense TaxID=1679163 RepID=A0ABQ1KBP1_9GAMM|nr:HAD-IA family hydrolase [Marinobacterium zhoushanense]GGB92990.1 hydrolase [Marinobacterium zhoushanense]